MKEIPLTQGKVTIIDDDMINRVSYFKWYTIKKSRRVGDAYYVVTSFGKKRRHLSMHRLIMGNICDEFNVDHINGNGLDNRRENLRICTNSQNAMNRRKLLGCSSIYKGVFYQKRLKKWAARYKINGVRTVIGYFDNEEGAALAYNKAVKIHFGEFALLNTIKKVA